MSPEVCMYCRYGHKHWGQKRVGGCVVDVGPGYYGCHFLPHWGKRVETIDKCPKVNEDGTENEWTLKSVCHVNPDSALPRR